MVLHVTPFYALYCLCLLGLYFSFAINFNELCLPNLKSYVLFL